MANPKKDTSALDLAVVAAEHWIILLLVPLIVGLITYVGAISLPPTYSASVSLTVPVSDTMDDPIFDTAIFYRAAFAEREEVNVRLASSDSVSFISAAPSATQAYGFVRSAYADTVSTVVDQLEANIDDARASMAAYAPLFETVGSKLGGDSTQGRELMELRAVTAIYGEKLHQASRIIEAIENEPHVSVRRLGPSPFHLAAIGWLLTSLAVLVVVSVRHGYRSAGKTSAGREKVQKVQQAFSSNAQH